MPDKFNATEFPPMKDQLETLQSPITTLELPIRLEAALYRAGLKTVGDVVALTPHRITALPNVGMKSLEHLTVSLKSRDLCLTGENPAQIEQTTPPQDGAPVTEAESGSALQSTRYTRNLPIYAILLCGTDLMVWEVLDDQIVPCTTMPKGVDDLYRNQRKDGLVAHGRLQVCVRMRSFFGFVDNLIPVMETDLSPKEIWSADVGLAVQKALFE